MIFINAKRSKKTAESRDWVCPCGQYLGSTTQKNGSYDKYCSACRRRIKITVTPNGVYAVAK